MKQQSNPKYQTILRLIIRDFLLTPDFISERIGLSSSKVWAVGEPKYKKNPAILHTTNGWIWTNPLESDDSDVSEQFTVMKQFLEPKATKIVRLSEEAQIVVSCVVYAYSERPALYLSAEDIKLVAALGADFEFDLYDLREANPT